MSLVRKLACNCAIRELTFPWGAEAGSVYCGLCYSTFSIKIKSTKLVCGRLLAVAASSWLVLRRRPTGVAEVSLFGWLCQGEPLAFMGQSAVANSNASTDAKRGLTQSTLQERYWAFGPAVSSRTPFSGECLVVGERAAELRITFGFPKWQLCSNLGL